MRVLKLRARCSETGEQRPAGGIIPPRYSREIKVWLRQNFRFYDYYFNNVYHNIDGLNIIEITFRRERHANLFKLVFNEKVVIYENSEKKKTTTRATS
jgi:hypothetical protein